LEKSDQPSLKYAGIKTDQRSAEEALDQMEAGNGGKRKKRDTKTEEEKKIERVITRC